MRFSEKKAIYLQIADWICDKILREQYHENERIPSVRDIASEVEVNSNTVMRSFDWLQNQQIIYSKRGLGYFVSNGAKDIIKRIKKEEFFEEQVPELVRSMKSLYITVEEIQLVLENYYSKIN